MSPEIEIQKPIFYDSENYYSERERFPEYTHDVDNITNFKSWCDIYTASESYTNDNASSSKELINCNAEENQSETNQFVKRGSD